MKVFDSIHRPSARRFRLVTGIALVIALCAGGTLRALAASASSAKVPTETDVDALALKWFATMQTGRIDRTQYTPSYGASLTDDAVKAMSHHLNQYGASPTRAEILESRSVGAQTFYMVKLLFPRGDAASILFGLDPQGKITAISIVTMAGD